MTRIAPIYLENNPKVFWFDANGFDLQEGEGVVVQTVRGIEFARVAGELFEPDKEKLKELKSPLKPVIRRASPADEQQQELMREKSKEALPIFKEIVAQSELDIHPVSVEFLLEGDKAVFYFESEQRIDFRELVRKLAAQFHVRVDMRQIGARDEARMIGGYAHCGQELCCKRLGGEFMPVSIRMAKDQNLSLNPQKISGLCGRLMCCLRYECDIYKDFNKRAPKRGENIQTPEGQGKVIDLDVLHEIVVIKVEDGKPVRIALEDIVKPSNSKKSPFVKDEVWEQAQKQNSMVLTTLGPSLATSQFSGKDKLFDRNALLQTRRAESATESADRQGTRDAEKSASRSSKKAGVRDSSGGKRSQRRSRKRQIKIESNQIAEVSSLSFDSQDSGRSVSAKTKQTGASRATDLSSSVISLSASSEEKRTSKKQNRKAGRYSSRTSSVEAVRQSGSQTERSPKKIEVHTPSARPGHKSSGVRDNSEKTMHQGNRAQRRKGDRQQEGKRTPNQQAPTPARSAQRAQTQKRPDTSQNQKRSHKGGTAGEIKAQNASVNTATTHTRRSRRRSHTLDASDGGSSKG